MSDWQQNAILQMVCWKISHLIMINSWTCQLECNKLNSIFNRDPSLQSHRKGTKAPKSVNHIFNGTGRKFKLTGS